MLYVLEKIVKGVQNTALSDLKLAISLNTIEIFSIFTSALLATVHLRA
jgi:hypothetical protein